jgi:release factor glutamine methyltransferase
MVSLHNLYQKITDELNSSGVDTASLDARLIMQGTLAISDVDFITDAHSRLLDDAEVFAVQRNIERRCDGKPVSRIFGQREFWGLSFFINEHCLDPRPDTETVIEAVLGSYSECRNDSLRFVDFGTGSGCILISLLREFPNATGVAVDISEQALKVAKKNAQNLNVDSRISFICSDWDSAIKLSGENRFDVVVSNPPYIESEVIPKLQREVIHFDPALALDGGVLGLDPYEELIPKLKKILTPAGKCFFEIGKGQESDLERLIVNADANLSRVIPDLAGIARVVEISCGDK